MTVQVYGSYQPGAKCVACGKSFPSTQCDNFASWTDGEVVTSYFGSDFDGEVLTWKESAPYEQGPICDSCVTRLLKEGAFNEDPETVL